MIQSNPTIRSNNQIRSDEVWSDPVIQVLTALVFPGCFQSQNNKKSQVRKVSKLFFP